MSNNLALTVSAVPAAGDAVVLVVVLHDHYLNSTCTLQPCPAIVALWVATYAQSGFERFVATMCRACTQIEPHRHIHKSVA